MIFISLDPHLPDLTFVYFVSWCLKLLIRHYVKYALIFNHKIYASGQFQLRTDSL